MPGRDARVSSGIGKRVARQNSECTQACRRRNDRLVPTLERALEVLEQRVAEGNFALHALASSPHLELRFLEGEALSAWGDSEEIFANLNTPADLERWGLYL